MNHPADASDFIPSEEELEAWLVEPKFFVSKQTLRLPLPTLSDETKQLWHEDVLDGGDQLKFISDHKFGVKKSSMMAVTQYSSVKKLMQEHPDFPLFSIVLAECHFMMNDSYGAYLLANAAQKELCLMDIPDADLGKTIIYLAKSAEMEMAEPEELQSEAEGNSIRLYGRPGDWISSSEPSDLVELQLRWAKLEMITDGRDMFVRCSCVQSNELEGVFRLVGDSEKMLTRFGFFLSSIEGISHQSRTRQPAKVVMILENTQHCYNMITSVVEDTSLLTVNFLTQAHAILLANDNLEVDTVNGMVRIVPVGRFRATPCYTFHDDAETHFCPVDQINKEMTWFINVTQQIITEEDIDPFRAAAWIHHAFLSIHPFADGNGRMARIIASIPLLKAKLPPIFVATESKKSYFSSLEAGDVEGDIDPLAHFLQNQVFAALERLLEYNGQDTSIQSVLTGTTVSSTDNSISGSES